MKKLGIFLLICLMIGTLFAGCGSLGAPEVDLNDYVVISEVGYDGYGHMDVGIDFGRLVSEYSDRLSKDMDTSVLGDQTAAAAAEFAFYTYQPYTLVYEEQKDLSNGTTVAFTWKINEEAAEKLRAVLDVKLTCADFTHTVQSLESLTQVDPFAYVQIDHRGVSGCTCYGYESYVNTGFVEASIPLKDGNTLYLSVRAEDPGDQTWKNGDTIRACLEDYDPAQLAQEYGIALSRTEAQITLNDFAYFPSDTPADIFRLLSPESIAAAQKVMESNYSMYEGDIKVTYVGALLYYADSHYDTMWEKNLNNQLVFIYHIDNGIYPGGWYNYLAPDCDAYIGFADNEAGEKTKMTVGRGYTAMFTNATCRSALIQQFVMPGQVEVAQHFVHEGLYYAGFTTLEDCLKGMEYLVITHETDVYGNPLTKNYNHLIVTDELKEFVTEY